MHHYYCVCGAIHWRQSSVVDQWREGCQGYSPHSPLWFIMIHTGIYCHRRDFLIRTMVVCSWSMTCTDVCYWSVACTDVCYWSMAHTDVCYWSVAHTDVCYWLLALFVTDRSDTASKYLGWNPHQIEVSFVAFLVWPDDVGRFERLLTKMFWHLLRKHSYQQRYLH